MSSVKSNKSLPDYLQSYNALVQHFRAELDGESNTEKGSKFAQFVQRLVPQTEVGNEFSTPDLNEKKSWDGGIDLVASSKSNNSVLYIQAKLWVDKADDIDGVLSKFSSFQSSHASSKANQTSINFDDQNVQFLLVTLSDISNILTRYEGKAYTSRDFYNQLQRENRVHFVHSHEIFGVIKALYTKVSQVPANLTIKLEADAVQMNNVFMGVISSTELKSLYSQFGDALFFENIRDFMGFSAKKEGRSSPNQEIINTIRQNPSQMLERNNGIVIKAEKVTLADSKRHLELERGSIVNGCQTTMCIVENADHTCYVPLKIVKTNDADAWSITKAANYQNSVNDIDLDLARYLRPQVVRRAAVLSNVRMDHRVDSVFNMMDIIHNQRITYDETRLFYIGMFSRSPSNVFNLGYADLNLRVVDRFYQDDAFNQETFETLFALQSASQKALEEARELFKDSSYANIFKRLYNGDSPTYHCMISILALCGAIGVNITEHKPDTDEEFRRMSQFFDQARLLLQQDQAKFRVYYLLAVEIWMNEMLRDNSDDMEIARVMYDKTRRANFTNLYRMIRIKTNIDPRLQT